MRPNSEILLRKLVTYYHLEIEYSRDLPSSCCGFLDHSPDPSFIVVNANLPDYEKVFTIAHELIHFLRHTPSRRPIPFPKYLERDWRFPILNRIRKLAKRYMRRWFSKEVEADTLAIGLLSAVGARSELKQWIHHHPEKQNLVLLMIVGSILGRMKKIMKPN